MNKHILETKIRSIAHYKSEIEKLEDAVKVNKDVIKELLKEILEYFPYKAGDILFISNYIFRIDEVVEAKTCNDVNDIIFYIKINYQTTPSGFQSNSSAMHIKLSDINKFKKLNNE